MVLIRYFAALATAIGLSSAAFIEDDWAISLLKRQAPGTPAYDCHLNCGTAIIIGREAANPCTNSTFLSDYQACLNCAGPDNEDIWQYYGATLTVDGQACGLSTTPVSDSASASSSVSSSPETAQLVPPPSSSVITDADSAVLASTSVAVGTGSATAAGSGSAAATITTATAATTALASTTATKLEPSISNGTVSASASSSATPIQVTSMGNILIGNFGGAIILIAVALFQATP